MRTMYTEFNYTGEIKLGDPLTVVTIESKDGNSYMISWEEDMQ